jgi:hypothetical protein
MPGQVPKVLRKKSRLRSVWRPARIVAPGAPLAKQQDARCTVGRARSIVPSVRVLREERGGKAYPASDYLRPRVIAGALGKSSACFHRWSQ